MNFMKTLPIHILAKKIKFWERLESKCNLSNTYDGSANFSDSPKVWQMKLRLWHGILPKNGQCLLGTKKSKIMPNVGFELFLSLPFTFPVLVNENPCQIYTENNQISIFNFFPPKFGALPILQECPCCINKKSSSNTNAHRSRVTQPECKGRSQMTSRGGHFAAVPITYWNLKQGFM